MLKNSRKYEFGLLIPVEPKWLLRWFDHVTNQVHVLMKFLTLLFMLTFNIKMQIIQNYSHYLFYVCNIATDK